jgi:hypothetical protein
VTIAATSKWQASGESGACLVIPRERLSAHSRSSKKADEESQVHGKAKSPESDAHESNSDVETNLFGTLLFSLGRT